MTKRDEFLKKMEKQLEKWNTEIDALEQKVKLLKSDLKDKYQRRVDDLRLKRNEGEKKIEKIRSSTEETWERLKNETEHAWSAFKDAVDTFKSHYAKDTQEKEE